MTMTVVRGVDLLRDALARPRWRSRKPSAAAERLRAEALRLARDESLLAAAYTVRIVTLDAPPDEVLHAAGETLHAPRLVPGTGRLTALGCAVCTLGPALEERVRALFAQRRAALAIALDELGNVLLSELSRRAQDRLQAQVARQGLTMAGELRPGDPGLALDAQPAVLRLAGADAIGVTVSERLLMTPRKSTSMVLGVGVDLPPAQWSRCDECPKRADCRLVARAAAAQTAPAAVAT